jgi:hypothetical protein
MARDKDALNDDVAGLRADIDRQRTRMDHTLDALAHKLTGRELMAEIWDQARHGGSAGAWRLARLLREHPVPAALIGLGIAGIVYESRREPEYEVDYEYGGVRQRSSLERAKSAVRRRAGAVSEASSRAAEGAKKAFQETTERLSNAGSVAGQAREAVSVVKESAGGLAETAREKTRRARDRTRALVDERPLTLALGALAAGFLVALALPSSRREDRLFGAARDRFMANARSAAREAFDKGQEAARHALDTAEATVRDAARGTRESIESGLPR